MMADGLTLSFTLEKPLSLNKTISVALPCTMCNVCSNIGTERVKFNYWLTFCSLILNMVNEIKLTENSFE